MPMLYAGFVNQSLFLHGVYCPMKCTEEYRRARVSFVKCKLRVLGILKILGRGFLGCLEEKMHWRQLTHFH